jgi:hypothetical protein
MEVAPMGTASGQAADLPPIVEDAEHAYIKAWRAQTGRSERPSWTGLALSGGGIRSAVFCLGVLQGLARHGLLKNFDYLSTVSGGGYIGSSLTWFTSDQTRSFGVNASDLPYGIDDPTQLPPRMPPGTPLLPHLRRHGSYLDPDGAMSLLPGIAVVVRGLLLNLFVIWLPIVTFAFTLLRTANRSLGHAVGPAWPRPLTLAAAVMAVFAAASIVYSLYSGLRAATNQDTPYRSRRVFERVTPPILMLFAIIFVLGTLPLVRDLAARSVGENGILGTLMTIAGAALGVWSRLVPRTAGGDRPPTWIGPVAAALVIYGIGLLAYWLSGAVFAGSHLPAAGIPLYLLLAAVALAILVGWLVDLNETTLHRFYRDRLMEAFMPDTAAGAPLPAQAAVADGGRLHAMCPEARARAPYHLVCAHLVLTEPGEQKSKGLAGRLRIRGGDSFVFAPRFCGGTAAGWHETETSGALSELTLATAMAISGAAVNPNAATSGVGPQRNTVFAMLMALLNIRLGYWLPNPKLYGRDRSPPLPNHFNAGISGVLDRLSPDSSFFELADGGNFENLAVYELIRRRVQTILLCDAGHDPGSAFADLQNLLSRIEADFEATITFRPPPLDSLMPSTPQARFPLGVAFAKAPFVVGDIRYKDGSTGKLYLIKPAIFEGLRLNVLGFKGANPEFPHDTTNNQFFDEARFEAYRELGFACVDRLLAEDDIRTHLAAM